MEGKGGFDWNLGGLAERHTALVAAKEALSPELLREVEDYWKSAMPGEAFDPRRAVALLLKIAAGKAGRAEADLLAWRNPDAKPMPEVIDEDRDRRRAEKLNEAMRQAEAYWNETAPWGGEKFTAERGIGLLLHDLRRMRAAVARIFEKEREQKALVDHKTATGQDAEADRQRWLAYLDVTHAATAALSPGGPHSPSENSGPEQK
jgi:hypothetical protein